MRHPFAAVLLLTGVMTACSLSPGEDAQGGPGLPQQIPGETYPGDRSELIGEVQVARNGCIDVVVDGISRMVIWPAGSELADAVRLPDGASLVDGDGAAAAAPSCRSTRWRAGRTATGAA